MAFQRNSFSLLSIILFFFSLSLPGSVFCKDKDNGPEVGDEHPFTYEVGTKRGPENWGKIKPEWQLCNAGKSQSPIDLQEDNVKVFTGLRKLQRNYKTAPAVLRNRGHDISVGWKGDAGSVAINGTDYDLLQCHWHTPSEHTLNGKRYHMELHMVHNSSNGQIAVISILYKLGRPDPFLQQFLEHVKSVVTELDLGIVHPIKIKLGSRRYYRYTGSLTAPPCTEGVLWTIIKKVRTVSREQIRALRGAVYDGFEENTRPIQALNGRQVYLYRPEA